MIRPRTVSGNSVPDIIICFIIIGSLACIYILSNFIRFFLHGENSNATISQLIDQYAIEYGWLLRLIVNCFGYSCIFIPGLVIYHYTKATKYLERNHNGIVYSAVKFCFSGFELDRIDINPMSKLITTNAAKECAMLTFCFVGLMGSYLTWGLLQEKIITQQYENGAGEKAHFKDSQFLVFTNRLLALIIATIYLLWKEQSRYHAPVYKYSYASFSNIMSAWFQYEALKFVNFPTQVLAKSCKIIPVMLMGKIISRSKYEFYEYVTAVLISFGMIMFFMGSADGRHVTSITTMTGVLLLMLYMIFDSFTSNWQGNLFKTYSVSSIEMMCGVNLFSTLFTAASLLIQGGLIDSFEFAMEHPKFILDCVILSISSTIGQLFIFYTIATFGAVVFTIIMTLRQGVAILLSCIVYKHHLSMVGIFGICIVFLAIFLRVYCNQRLKTIRKRTAADASKSIRIGV